MKILVLGSGAREHALAWRLARDGHAVACAPGNPGAARVASLVPLDPADPVAVVAAARAQGSDLVVVGPEAPLVAGVVDALATAGIAAFGPSAKAARLEGSKAFAKEFMVRHGIATAPFVVCDDVVAADRAVDRFLAEDGRVVLKADGLAAGKGVLVTARRDEARAFARAEAPLVEAFLAGEEGSLFFLSDGTRIARFLPARDFKRLGDGDHGPNTGGMGAYAPSDLDPGLAERVERTIALPTIEGLATEGTPFRGLLYVGLIVSPDGA